MEPEVAGHEFRVLRRKDLAGETEQAGASALQGGSISMPAVSS